MAQLLDHRGRPVSTQQLLREEAAPQIGGVRPVLSDHPSRGLTPQRLAAILIEAEEGDATRYLELAEDMEEKDLNYLAQLGTRKRAVAQLDATVQAAGESEEEKGDARLIEDYLRRDDLEEVLFDVLDSVGKGYSVCELLWERTAKEWYPREIVWRDPRWFAFDREDGTTLKLREGAELRDLTPWKYIVHITKAKSGLPIRGGLARAISWIWLFKNFSVKDWVAFGEVYGQPYRVGKYHPSATKEEKNKLLQAVASIGSDAAAIIPEGMLIEFIESARAGSMDLYERMAKYFDEQVTMAVLGQTLTSNVGNSGSRALGEVHDKVRNDIKRADAKQLAATLNRYLVKPLIDLNRGPRKNYPQIEIGLPNELTTSELVDSIDKLVPYGFKVPQQPIRDRLGLPDPQRDDEVLGQPAATPAPEPTAAAQLKAAKHAAEADDDDAIDDQVRSALADGGWVPLVDPSREAIEQLLEESESLEDFRDRLGELLSGSSTDELIEMLARNTFTARLAGELGIDPTGDG